MVAETGQRHPGESGFGLAFNYRSVDYIMITQFSLVSICTQFIIMPYIQYVWAWEDFEVMTGVCMDNHAVIIFRKIIMHG